jgi:hypothetical protein
MNRFPPPIRLGIAPSAAVGAPSINAGCEDIPSLPTKAPPTTPVHHNPFHQGNP